MEKTSAGQAVLEVDVVAFAIRDGGLHVLLVRRAAAPFAGAWALPGARLGPAERLAHAARRALAERTGLDPGVYLEQLFTFDDPARDPRGRTVSVAYFALLPLGTPAPSPGRAIEEVRWWPADALPGLSFDHAEIVATARARVAAKVEYAPIAFTVLPEQFTIPELRAVHEQLTGRPVRHDNNFWRQITTRWPLEPTGRRTGGRGRPARLYRLGAAPTWTALPTPPAESSPPGGSPTSAAGPPAAVTVPPSPAAAPPAPSSACAQPTEPASREPSRGARKASRQPSHASQLC